MTFARQHTPSHQTLAAPPAGAARSSALGPTQAVGRSQPTHSPGGPLWDCGDAADVRRTSPLGVLSNVGRSFPWPQIASEYPAALIADLAATWPNVITAPLPPQDRGRATAQTVDDAPESSGAPLVVGGLRLFAGGT